MLLHLFPSRADHLASLNYAKSRQYLLNHITLHLNRLVMHETEVGPRYYAVNPSTLVPTTKAPVY